MGSCLSEGRGKEGASKVLSKHISRSQVILEVEWRKGERKERSGIQGALRDPSSGSISIEGEA